MKRFLKKVLLFSPLLLTGLSAGSVVTDFLSAADSDIDVKYRGIASLYEENVPQQYDYIDKARVSVRHSHFSDIEREYALRLYAKSPADLENETKSYALEKRLALSDENIALLNIRRQRYEAVLELLYKYSVLQLLDDTMRFEKEALHNARYFAQNESDITAVYKKREALRDTELEQSRLQMEYNALLTEIAQTVGKENEAVEKELNLLLFSPAYALIDHISANLDSNVSVAVDENPIVVKSLERVDLARQKVKSEQDKSGIKLDYVGLKYDDSKKSKNAFAVDVAVEIPLSKDTRKIVSEKVKLFKNRQKAEENRKKIVQKISGLRHELKDLISYFYVVDRQIQDTKPRKNNYYAFKLYESMKKRDLRLRKERLKVAWKTAQKYVAWLYWSNKLHETDFSKLLQRTQSGK